ncbi:hypothetical protein SDC9_192314 [bioreactor metagenome]|uniref:Uncharacterized protein n=1 Tax=bioreactor metagenome TaxID=1076179 RepID=A0A645I2V2_9ZZZZ
MKNVKEKNSEITLEFSMEKLEERLESIIVPYGNEIGIGGGCYIAVCNFISPPTNPPYICPLSSPVGAGTFALTH